MDPRLIRKMSKQKNHKTWAELKLQGSEHYKTGGAEPIDIMKTKGTFKPFALGSIQKYAVRNMEPENSERYKKDLLKIIHYAELLIAEANEKEQSW